MVAGEDKGWRCVWAANAQLGEGAIWDERDGCIYWVDIEAPSVNWINLATGQKKSWAPPQWVSALAPRGSGGFIASCADGFAYVDPERQTYSPQRDPIPDRAKTRLNDGATDRQGRYWSGSNDIERLNALITQGHSAAATGVGELYRLGADGDVSTMERGITVSNGPGFSPDGKTVYFNDTLCSVTWAYDLSGDGSLSNRRDFLKFGPEHGHPDGMAVDVEGCIWMAFVGSWVLRRFSPDAVLLEERKLPVNQGLRPAFGGENHSRLFLISGVIGLSDEARTAQPLAGSLFEILEPGVSGLPVVPFAG